MNRYAGKPEYGGEGYRGDDQDDEEERVHHSTPLPTLARRRAGKARPLASWSVGTLTKASCTSPGQGS
jgi:hypothetical protein